MAATNQSRISNPLTGAPGDRNCGPGWVLPSGRRLIEFVVAGGLAAPVLALAWKHVMRVERQKKKPQTV
jgi:hypothetical protein